MRYVVSLIIFLVFSSPSYSLEVGDIAPDFSLQGSDRKIHNLSGYHGKQAVVIAWFPKAYTRACTIECKSLAENGHLLKEFNVAYFMASVDPIERNIGFAEESNADFPLLSDPTREVARAYDVLDVLGIAARYTIYIDIDGRIMFIDKNVVPATSAQDIASRLEKLAIPRRSSLFQGP